MKKKLQIFISSTFSDLQIERQAAVEAVLRAGHIPAGMELFSAGSESQLEIIKRWIDESDVYMLILGGRYGSIEEKSKLGYTEIEYRYAMEKGKPVFAIVVSDALLEIKVKEFGVAVLERNSVSEYNDFKKQVLSKICRFFNDTNEIKICIFESLLDIQNRFELKGWVKFDDVPDLSVLLSQISGLQNELDELKRDSISANIPEKQIAIASKHDILYGGLKYEEIHLILSNRGIKIPASANDGGKEFDSNYFSIFVANSGAFNAGLDSTVDKATGTGILYKMASELMVFGLIEQSYVKHGQVNKSILRTSTDGKRFIAEYQLRKYKKQPISQLENKKDEPILDSEVEATS